MTTSMIDNERALARLLLQARRDAVPTEGVTDGLVPADAAAAYRVQLDQFELGGDSIGGWKVGAKSPDGPMQGAPLPAGLILPSGATLSRSAFTMTGLELEIAFRLGRDLPPRAGGYADAEVTAAFDRMLVTIELVASRVAGWPQIDKLAQLADLQNHAALVVSETVPFDATYPFLSPRATFTFNGENILPPQVVNPGGDLQRLLRWVVSHASTMGLTLTEGQIVTAGSYSGIRFVQEPGVARGGFEGLPPVELTLT